MREEKRIYSHKKTNMKYEGYDWGTHFIKVPNEITFFFSKQCLSLAFRSGQIRSYLRTFTVKVTSQ